MLRAPSSRSWSVSLALALAFATAAAPVADACTAITLRAGDGAYVYGRTMEWGAFDLHSRVMVVPRGQAFHSEMPDGQPGISWEGQHGFVALDGLGRTLALDGVNERGLVMGALYHPGFAEYAEFDPAARDGSIGPVDLGAYILGNFATVAELREALPALRVIGVEEPSLGFPAPLHFYVLDASGASVAVEFVGGVPTIIDAPLGVMTNAPSYDWHMTNLRNYINLSPVALPTRQVGSQDFAPLGAGTGMIGLPGDFTPPSRFVRAVAFAATARATVDGPETIYEAFRILDSFNVPLGASEGSDLGEGGDIMRSSTIWTSAVDTSNLVLYYHTMHNRRVRMVDLKKIDFGTLPEIAFLPLDREKSQDIEELTLP